MNRPGLSLAEVLIVAWLFGLVLLGVAGFAAAQSRMVARIHDRSRAQAVSRTTRVVLAAELGALDSSDISALSTDSLRIRAVRGGGPVCHTDATALFVRYRGVRRPDAQKDSVLVLREDRTLGRVQAIRRVARDERCDGALRLEVDHPGPATGWALVFETGSYHLAGRAFRYRRGGGGRQPLTEALLADGRFDRVPGGVRLELEFEADSLPRLQELSVATTIRLTNPGAP